MNDLKRILQGHFIVKGVYLTPIVTQNPNHPLNGTVEIEFDRKGRWNIFGWRKHRQHRYIRKNPDKIVRILRRKMDVSYIAIHSVSGWLVQFEPSNPTIKSFSNTRWITLTYMLYVIYLMLK